MKPRRNRKPTPKGDPMVRRTGGPSTPEAKARSSMNALKHGLTSTRVLLAREDPNEFLAFAQGIHDRWDPQDAYEEELVYRLTVALWNIRRADAAQAATMDIVHDLAFPVRQDLPAEARGRRAVASSVSNNWVTLLHRYRGPFWKEFQTALHELIAARNSRRLGWDVESNAVRFVVALPPQLRSPDTPGLDQ